MDLNDLYKLAGISRDDAPAIEPQPVEQVAEQPTDGRADMRAMIALVTPEQLNQLVGEAPVEEGDEYAASTTPNPQEYKGTLGSPSDNSLRRYLDAAGDHVTIDEDVYPDHTVENVSEAYKSFKAKHKTEAYSPGDENEEGMVSNCCGAPIMDVYQGHGRCSDCKEMASAVKESIQESSADDFLKSLNQDPLYFPGAQIAKNDDGSITLVASNGEEVADIDVKTGDIVLVNGDDYNIADDEDAEQNLQTMYAEINGDNGDMDMDEECKYCGGDCPNDEDHACDGYLGDIDGLYEGRMKDMYTELEDLEPQIMRLKTKYMDRGMEPEEAQDMACEKMGCDPELFDEYLTMKMDESALDEAEIELAPGYTIKTDKPGIYKGTKTTSGFVGGKSGEAMYMANRVLDAIEYQDPASSEEVFALARKFCKEMGVTDDAKKRVYKELVKMGWTESVDEADGEITKASVKKSALELLVDIAKTSKQYKGEVTDDQVHYLGSLVHDFDMAGIETEAYSEIEKLFRTMAVTHKADMTMIQPAYAQAKALDESLDEADVEENAFNQAAAAAARAGKDSFEFGGKKHKTTMKKDTAHKLDDDINSLKKLAGLAAGKEVEESIDEGKMSDMLIHDSETLSKEEFSKKHGKDVADEYYEAAIGAPDYNPSKGSYADMPTQVKLAGDSIWDKEKSNPEMVTVTDVEVVEGDEGYVEVTVEHDGPWTIYTDTGFEEAISDMIDMEVSFSEQGMQEDGRAHLEGNDEDVTLERIKKLSGI